MITILVQSADGTVLASSEHPEEAFLSVDRVYQPGDVIRISGGRHLRIQMDQALPSGEVYLPDDPAYHVDAGYDMESGERAVLRMLSGLDRSRWPSAIVTFNDLVALGVMKQLKKMGLKLPDDMAIIGCDNQFFCAYTDPSLTSVDLHPEEMARSAVRELLLARESSSRSFAMVREATLVVRESCGAQLGFRKL